MTPASNAVVFQSAAVPTTGQTIEVRYRSACVAPPWPLPEPPEGLRERILGAASGGPVKSTGSLPLLAPGRIWLAPPVETFGRYELLRKLATGGMGQVFLARQKGPVGFQKLLVVKRLLPHLSEDTDFIKMFLDEARIAGILNHPNIAQIYELGDVDGVLYIAMEYVQGEAVSQVNARANHRSKGGLPLGLKCRIIADAAAGLDHAHQAR